MTKIKYVTKIKITIDKLFKNIVPGSQSNKIVYLGRDYTQCIQRAMDLIQPRIKPNGQFNILIVRMLARTDPADYNKYYKKNDIQLTLFMHTNKPDQKLRDAWSTATNGNIILSSWTSIITMNSHALLCAMKAQLR